MTYHKPRGGYFISLNVSDGCAKRVFSLAKECGVCMTDAGATYPYGMDPKDRNLRIAPTYPSIEELQTAVDILCCCVKIAALENCCKITVAASAGFSIHRIQVPGVCGNGKDSRYAAPVFRVLKDPSNSFLSF